MNQYEENTDYIRGYKRCLIDLRRFIDIMDKNSKRRFYAKRYKTLRSLVKHLYNNPDQRELFRECCGDAAYVLSAGGDVPIIAPEFEQLISWLATGGK